MALWRALARWADQRPDHLALLTPDSQLTYAQLIRRSSALAQQIGSLPGNRIGVHTSDPIEMAIAFYAIVLSGRTLAVIDPAWPENLAIAMTANLQCDFVIASPIPMSSLGVPILAFFPEPPVDDEYAAPTTNFPGTRDLLIICTSGSASHPKPVVRTAASWEESLRAGAPVLGASPDQATLCPSPISHGLGLYAMVESVHAGGTFLATGKWDLDGVRSLLGQSSCTRIVSVPTILDRVLALVEPAVLSNLRIVVSGGEALGQDSVQLLHQIAPLARCVEYFGSSEHSLIAYRERMPNQPKALHFEGQLFSGVRAHIHDESSDTGFGLLYVDSPFNAKGYAPSTDTPISRCGTSIGIGDRAKLVGPTRIAIARRDDGMMNLNGNNVHPGEVSAALEAVGLSSTIVRVDTSGAEPKIVAYTVSSPRSPSALLADLQQQLPRYKIPHKIVYLRSWPETFSGKLNTAALKIQDLDIERRDWLR
ncbi:class I adenylate-forming enzyme family protein [Glutamicibacter sp.]|uniref:class I adenylate-forming enzyme family protein n=1 Tax=Glutamicibacter sp. TaxID=1931995 RepID=UPI003D6AFC89